MSLCTDCEPEPEAEPEPESDPNGIQEITKYYKVNFSYCDILRMFQVLMHPMVQKISKLLRITYFLLAEINQLTLTL